MKDWFKRSIIYSLDVEAFRDGDADGVGDFTGLSKSVPYLDTLGVNCLWLLPFYDTPNKDNGYDVKDYYAVDPRLGNLGTFTEFMDNAREHNIQIVMDLVVNHSSNEHPWFQEALKGPDNSYHDYYIWADRIPDDYEPKNIFGEQQSGNWEYVKDLDRYYYHTFYNFQPDLNLANPRVRSEVKRIMRFWLKTGVAGFRMDAATHMIGKKHKSQQFDIAPHDILTELRRFVANSEPQAFLLAEADVEPEKYEDFFPEKGEMDMLLNFYGNNYLFYSLTIESAAPLVNAFHKLPNNRGTVHFANFIRNHDELDLERLSEEERQKVFDRFAPDEDMRIFGRGIRRRFASMVNRDREMLELAYSVLFSLPGTPILRYGEEIGMGDNQELPGREAVRTAMQWSTEMNGGFSQTHSKPLARPVIEDGPTGYKNLNVNDQLKDKDSFLNWMVAATMARRRCSEFGTGQYEFLDSGDDGVMIHICRGADTAAVAVHNFSGQKKTVSLNIEPDILERLIDIFGDASYASPDIQNREVHINPKGYRWLRTGF